MDNLLQSGDVALRDWTDVVSDGLKLSPLCTAHMDGRIAATGKMFFS